MKKYILLSLLLLSNILLAQKELFNGTVVTVLTNPDRIATGQPSVGGSKNITWQNLMLQIKANLSSVATTGNYNDLISKPSVGVAPFDLVQLNASGKLPAVDGSLLTNISGSSSLPITATNQTNSINLSSSTSQVTNGLINLYNASAIKSGLNIANTNGNSAINLTNTQNGFGVTVSNTGVDATGLYVINNFAQGVGVDIRNGNDAKGIYISNNGNANSIGIDLNSPIGKGLKLTNNTGTAIEVNNPGNGVGLKVNNTNVNFGVDILNTGGGIGNRITNSTTGVGLDIENTGTYGILLNNTAPGKGMQIANISSGTGLYLSNHSGTGIKLYNTGVGIPLDISNLASTKGINLDNQSGIGIDVFNSMAYTTGMKIWNATESVNLLQSSAGISINKTTTRALDIYSSGVNGIYVTNSGSSTGIAIYNLTTNQPSLEILKPSSNSGDGIYLQNNNGIGLSIFKSGVGTGDLIKAVDISNNTLFKVAYNGAITTASNITTSGNISVTTGNITAPTINSANANIDRLILSAGTTTVAPLTFTTGNLLTTPAEGSMEYKGHTFYATTYLVRRSIVLAQNVLTSQQVIPANNTTETTVYTIPMAANYATAGKQIEVRIAGTITQRNNVASYYTVRVKFSGTTIFTFTSPTNVALANIPFHIDINAVCRTIGATGKMIAFSHFDVLGTGETMTMSTESTINTTIDNTLTITVQANEANANTGPVNIEMGRTLCIDNNQ